MITRVIFMFVSNLQQVLIKRIKEDKFISQSDLADKMGVSKVAVSKWIAGGSIDSNKIPLLCTILEITPNQLFGFEENLESIKILDIVNSDPELKRFILSRK